MNKIKVCLLILFLSLVPIILFTTCTDSRDTTTPVAAQDDPPSVVITYPPKSAELSDSFEVKADVTDDGQITLVVFFVDGDSVGVDNTAPYSFQLDTNYISSGGAHALLVKAYDNAGNAGHSEAIAITYNGYNCDCEVCCEILGIMSCSTAKDVSRDDCSVEGQGVTGVCTAECK